MTIDARKLTCVHTQPLGLPVVPDVYSRMAGDDAGIGTVSSVSGRPAVSAAQSWSRPGCIGVATRSPSRRHTTTCCTDGTAASASSSTAFIGTGAPRRQVPSAQITALAGPSLSRATNGCGPKPLNSGITTAPSLSTAKKPMKVSGRLGMYRPTTSPGAMPRSRIAAARRQTSASKAR